jgi:hypothetical protein
MIMSLNGRIKEQEVPWKLGRSERQNHKSSLMAMSQQKVNELIMVSSWKARLQLFVQKLKKTPRFGLTKLRLHWL